MVNLQAVLVQADFERLKVFLSDIEHGSLIHDMGTAGNHDFRSARLHPLLTQGGDKGRYAGIGKHKRDFGRIDPVGSGGVGKDKI